MKVVIDTNVLVSSLSSKSIYHWLIKALLKGEFEIFVTDEILLEYEEVLKDKYSVDVASNFLLALNDLPNAHFCNIYYHWNLIRDQDDNKFADCYVAAGAQYLVSNDSDFSNLKSVPFPKINVLKIDEFEIILNGMLNKFES